MKESLVYNAGVLLLIYGYGAIVFGRRLSLLLMPALYLNYLSLALCADALIFTSFDRVQIGEFLIQFAVQIPLLEAVQRLAREKQAATFKSAK